MGTVKDNIGNEITIHSIDEIEKLNKKISEDVNSLNYWYYTGNNKILENDNKIFQENLEKLIEFEYSYKYSLYQKCCKLEDMIKYFNLLQIQENYRKNIQQK